jgi:hypothetical protein
MPAVTDTSIHHRCGQTYVESTPSVRGGVGELAHNNRTVEVLAALVATAEGDLLTHMLRRYRRVRVRGPARIEVDEGTNVVQTTRPGPVRPGAVGAGFDALRLPTTWFGWWRAHTQCRAPCHQFVTRTRAHGLPPEPTSGTGALAEIAAEQD